MIQQLIKEKQDLTYLSWSIYRGSSGTAGSYLKSYSQLGGKKIYYKLSNFDQMNGVIGHECVNELIVDRLLQILGVPHLRYQLIHADVLIDGKIHDVYLCASEDFKDKGESKIALDTYYSIEGKLRESPLDFCIRNGWEEFIYQMLVVDFLILNRDRHGANIEVLKNNRKKTVRLAPLFDHGISLLSLCSTDKIEEFDVLEDRICNNYIATKSTYENLKLIPKDKIPHFNKLKNSDYEFVMEGLDNAIPKILQNKIWEMIWKRWCVYEDFCNSR